METVEPPVTPTPDETSKSPLTLKARYERYMARFKEFIAHYGALALIVHFGSGALFILCVAVLIISRLEDRSFERMAGALAAAYFTYKAAQIPRLAFTFLVTPIIDRIIRRLRHKPPDSSTP